MHSAARIQRSSGPARARHSSEPGPASRPDRAPTGTRRWRELDIANALDSTGPLLTFLVATLLVVGGVWLLTLSSTVWMLVVAFALHAAATVLVLFLTAALLGD